VVKIQGDAVNFCNIKQRIIEYLKEIYVEVRLPPLYEANSIPHQDFNKLLSLHAPANVGTITTGLDNMKINEVDTFLEDAKNTLKCLNKMLVCDFTDIKAQSVMAICQMVFVDQRFAALVGQDESLMNNFRHAALEADELDVDVEAALAAIYRSISSV